MDVDYSLVDEVIIVVFRDIFLTLLRRFADNVGLHVKTSLFGKLKTFAQMTFILFVLLMADAYHTRSIKGILALACYRLQILFLRQIFDVLVDGIYYVAHVCIGHFLLL